LYINSAIGPGPQASDLAVLVQQELAKINIHVTIDNVGSESEFSSGLFGHKYSATLFEASSLVSDPAYWIRLIFTNAGNKVFGYYSNSVLNSIAARMAITPAGPIRDSLVTKALGILNSELPLIPLVDEVEPWVWRSHVLLPGPMPLGSIYFQDVRQR
jgi:peptide/nickel transport system substrate-binding protein